MRDALIAKHEILIVRLIKAVLAGLPFLVLFGLLNHHYVFTPSVSYTLHPGRESKVIRLREPQNIVRTADPTLDWRLTRDVTPFSLTIPRVLKTVEVDIHLKLGTQPYVELLADGKNGNDIQTILHAQALEKLEWNRVRNGEYTLWMNQTGLENQPVAQYGSVEEFLAQPPRDLTRVAVLGIDQMGLVQESGQPTSGPIQIPHAFRGSHQLYLYSDGGDIQFSFEKIDLNRQVGPDRLTVKLARITHLLQRSPQWLREVEIEDDGQARGGGATGKSQLAELRLPEADPGVYLIEIETSEDVIFKNLVSRQSQIAFANHIFLAEGPTYDGDKFESMNILTDGSHLNISAVHAEGQQAVIVGGKRYSVDGIKTPRYVSGLVGQTPITLPRGDVIIEGDALFAFQEAKLPPSGARLLDVIHQPDFSRYDYVLSTYHPHNSSKDIIREVAYDFQALGLVVKQLPFQIVATGMQENGHTLGLKTLKVKFVRGAFPWNKVIEKIRGAI